MMSIFTKHYPRCKSPDTNFNTAIDRLRKVLDKRNVRLIYDKQAKVYNLRIQ